MCIRTYVCNYIHMLVVIDEGVGLTHVTCIQVHCNFHYLQCYVFVMYNDLLCYFVLKSPFNGEGDDELFESICSDSPRYPRWLNKHTLNLIDRVSEDGVK